MDYQVFVEFSKPVDDFCEATSYSLGTPMAGSYLAGSGNLKAQLYSFQFTKDRDSLSQAMMAHCAAGTVFDTVCVEIYQAGSSDVYITYTLSGVVIAAINSGGSGESVGLNWQSMKSAYAGQ